MDEVIETYEFNTSDENLDYYLTKFFDYNVRGCYTSSYDEQYLIDVNDEYLIEQHNKPLIASGG